MRDTDLTKLLGWPGYRVYRHEIDEDAKTLKLWVRRKRGQEKLVCSGCGREMEKAHDVNEREVRDLPCMEFRTTVVVEVYRVCCPDCGIKVEKVPQLPSKAPFSKRFEDAVGQACESAAARQVALRFGLAASTVRAIDLRYLERWAADRKRPVLAQMGVDEIHLGKKQKFITVVSNLDNAEPVWFGRERKKETLDGFFEGELTSRQRMRITAACVDMWEPYRLSIEQWASNCRIVYDKFHVMQHANKAIDEVRRTEFFRKGGVMRGLVKGKRWLLLSRWMNLSSPKRQELTELFAMNRKIFKAYLLKESLDRLWTYRSEGAMVNYLHRWIGQLRWQRLKPFQKLAEMLVSHLDGILNYCRTKVPLGIVEAINGNIKCLLRRGRGYKNLRYLLLKAQRIAATKTEFVAFRKAA
ncbi:MAG TPA: ISL3 family transposase [Candidatus Angelobacter sp.]|nr:ISL3 family transposase [Candidatus Angelobacter sp.]